MTEHINELTDRMKDAVSEWAGKKIDELSASRPRLRAVSMYLKRGLHNWMEREDKRIRSMVDGLVLFVADKDGQINTDTLTHDAVALFRDMEVCHTELCGFGVDYGKGAIVVNIPHNALFDIVFGDLGQVRITTNDLLEIKDALARSS